MKSVPMRAFVLFLTALTIACAYAIVAELSPYADFLRIYTDIIPTLVLSFLLVRVNIIQSKAIIAKMRAEGKEVVGVFKTEGAIYDKGIIVGCGLAQLVWLFMLEDVIVSLL